MGVCTFELTIILFFIFVCVCVENMRCCWKFFLKNFSKEFFDYLTILFMMS